MCVCVCVCAVCVCVCIPMYLSMVHMCMRKSMIIVCGVRMHDQHCVWCECVCVRGRGGMYSWPYWRNKASVTKKRVV